MKRLCYLTVVLSLAVMTSLASSSLWAGGYELKGSSGGYNMDIKMNQDPQQKGYNDIVITITDKESKPVTDAEVEIEYLMPTFGARKPMMDYTTKAALADGKYQGRLNMPMAGEWRVLVKVVRGGKGEVMGFTFVAP